MRQLLSRVRMSTAIVAAKSTSAASQRLGKGGGTAIPGLVAERIDSGLIRKFSRHLDRGTVVIAGTNGKTTTSKLVADILEASGAAVVHNRSGSNLVQGVAATFASHSSMLGQPNGDAGVIESDEAAFPEILRRVQPDVVLLNNLFRDQLDRYGELKSIMNLWRPALEELPATSTVVVNADDPALVGLTQDLSANVVYFGMTGLTYRLESLQHAADSIVCPRCNTALTYDALYVSHLGEWRCPNCPMARPTLDVTGSEVQLFGDGGLSISIADDSGSTTHRCGMPGLYNAYNVLAAYAVCSTLGIGSDIIGRTIESFTSAFGRIERLTIQDRNLTIALVKNPVGFNEVLRMLTADGTTATPVMIVINDLDADSRDVSWLWDVDFELLAGDGPFIATAGIRGTDMANRLKYADVAESRILSLGEHLGDALTAFVERLPVGSSAWILPTYTAMLGTRKELVARGAVEHYWKTGARS
jgi:UDP-N-acetylmuramyl tripeptide synthase